MMADQFGIDIGNVLGQAEAIRAARINNQLSQNAIADQAKARELTPAALGGDQAATQSLFAIDPTRAAQVTQYISGLDDQKRAALARQTEEIGRAAAFVLSSDDPDMAYQQVRGMLTPELQAKMPPVYDPQFVELQLANASSIDQILSRNTPAKADLMSVPAGNTVYDPASNAAIFTAPEKTGTSADPAAVQKIDRVAQNLINTGTVTDPAQARDVATAIVDGRYRESRDPITNEVRIIDMATGQPVVGAHGAAPVPTVSAAPAVPVAEAPISQADPAVASQFGTQFANPNESFGVEGAVAGAINTAADALGVGAPFKDVQQTQADFGVLKETLLNDIAAGYGRQPPSWLLQEIRSLTPTAGTPFEGSQQAQTKLRSLGRHFQSELAIVDNRLQGQLSPTNRQELEATKSALEAGLARATKALESFGAQPSAPGVPVEITDDAGYDALPSGALFVGPDQKVRKKP